jgi:hypothetical protein
MWLKPLFARTSKNAKSGLRKWLEVLPDNSAKKKRKADVIFHRAVGTEFIFPSI